MYPKEQRYGNGVGAAPTISRGRTGMTEPVEKISTEQKLDSTDAIEVFQATTTKGKSAMASPRLVNLTNKGQASIAITLQVPIWTSDTAQSGSNYLQMLLPVGASMSLPTTRILDSLNANTMDGTVVSNTAPDSNMYVASVADVKNNTLANTTDPVNFGVVVSAAANSTLIRVGDLIRVENEVMEVLGTYEDDPTASSLVEGDIRVARGKFGTTTASHSDTPDIRLPFFNAYGNYNKFSTARTGDGGRFKAKNFFGYGRGATVAASGILPGSINIKFYEPGYQEVGLSGVTANTNSGLSAGTTYYFKIAVDGGSVYEVAFTTDTSNVNFGGTNGIVSKIQDIFDTQYYTEGGGLFEKKVTVSIMDGDIRFTSGSRLSTSAIALTAGTSGTANVDELFDGSNQIGRIPAVVESAVAAKLPDDYKYNRETYDTYSNTSQFMWDDGNGHLQGVGTGTIDYDTGEIDFMAYPNAEFVVSVAHSCGLAGRQSSTASNIIEKIYARSTNAKVETVLGLDIE